MQETAASQQERSWNSADQWQRSLKRITDQRGEELTLVHGNPCAAQTGHVTHTCTMLSRDQNNLEKMPRPSNTDGMFQTRAHMPDADKQCAQAATRQTVLSVLEHAHEEGKINLHEHGNKVTHILSKKKITGPKTNYAWKKSTLAWQQTNTDLYHTAHSRRA